MLLGIYTFTLHGLFESRLFRNLGLKQILDEAAEDNITHHGCPRGAGAKRKCRRHSEH